MKKNIAALFLAALFCRADCTEWDHPLWLGRGDVWRARFPVVISNPSDKPLAGTPVTVIVGGGPGQAPLAGARVDPEAAELLREFAALLDIPNAGGRHSTKILPDPSRLAALRMRAGAALQRRARATSKVPQ